MDYIARFGLEFNPFLKNSKEILVENEETHEVRFRLNYLVETKGFGLLTGSRDSARQRRFVLFFASLNPSRYKVVYSSLSTLTVQEFYRLLASSFGAEPASRKIDNFKLIQDSVNYLALEKGSPGHHHR